MVEKSGSEKFKLENLPDKLPILPLRNSVFFPGAIMPLTIGRSKTIKLIEEITLKKSLLGIISQKSSKIDNPNASDIYNVGTAARIIKLSRTAKDSFNIVIGGISRFKINKIIQTEPFFIGKITPLRDEEASDVETEALALNLKNIAREVIDLLPEIPTVAKQLIDSISQAGHLADLITANIDASIDEKQTILETIRIKSRLKKVLKLIIKQSEILKLSNKINNKVKIEISKTQKEYYLRQQLKAIREELGNKDNDEENLGELRKKLKLAKLPKEAKIIAEQELKKMKNMQSNQAEYSVSHNYLDWLSDLPWRKYSKDNLDLDNAEKILNKDHYGLKKIKKRILEYLAVRKLKSNIKAPIICFLGPPGTGKTSLGKSIANAINRKFHRISLGGIHDEAEIRGHRRTYVGALPGKIIQGIKKVKVSNPVFLLDEIDKIGGDFRGDPSSALLEALDPEQNNSFNDNYINISFDLSRVLFIATANQIDTIPAALQDRMEVIEISSYTSEEKVNIAKNHLLPKQIKEHGINEDHIKISNKTLLKIITQFTREAGVRNLERELASICRVEAVSIAKNRKKTIKKQIINEKNLEKFLGNEKNYNEKIDRTPIPGVSIGLAWTPFGGELLSIEATKMGGNGSLILTGQLGDVMRESAQTALSWVKSNALRFKLIKKSNEYFLSKTDIHIHFPAGAIPKDGPSAGIAIISSLISLLTQRCVKLDTAMTGEITLRGSILPVGGIKEKILAANRAKIKNIILPYENKIDLNDIPQYIKKEINFIFGKTIDEVLSNILS